MTITPVYPRQPATPRQNIIKPSNNIFLNIEILCFSNVYDLLYINLANQMNSLYHIDLYNIWTLCNFSKREILIMYYILSILLYLFQASLIINNEQNRMTCLVLSFISISETTENTPSPFHQIAWYSKPGYNPLFYSRSTNNPSPLFFSCFLILAPAWGSNPVGPA